MKEIFFQSQNLVFILLTTIIVFYYPTVSSLYQLWMSGESWAYSHGPLAFFISLYIFGRYWVTDSGKLSYRIHFFGAALLLGATTTWMLADLGNIQVLQQLSLLALVSLLFWGLFGFAVFTRLIIPALIMLTAIPMWDFLDYYLQFITTTGVSFLLGFTAIPYVREGFEIQLYSGTFKVEDVCSGLRMLTAITPVALLYIYLNNFRWQVGIIYVALALMAAMLANIIRILIVVIAGHLTEMQHYFVTTDHVMLGWVVFGVVVFTFIFLSNWILLSEGVYPYVVKKSASSARDNFSIETNLNIPSNSRVLSTVVFFALVLATGPALTKVFSYPESLQNSIELESTYGPWNKIATQENVLKPIYLGNDYEALLSYQNLEGKSAQFYLSVYKEQKQGKEAIHYKNRPYDSRKEKLKSEMRFTFEMENLGDIPVTEYKVDSAYGKQKLIWQWYYTNGVRINTDTKAKLLGIKGRLIGDPVFTVIVISTDLGDGYEAASSRLKDLLLYSLVPIEKDLESLT